MKHVLVCAALVGVSLSPTVQGTTITRGIEVPNWTPDLNVSGDVAKSLFPRVAQDPSGNVHVVWDSGESINGEDPATHRGIRYAKGVWNGTTYSFGPSIRIADEGGFGFMTPSVAVAPNGRLMLAWSPSFRSLRVMTWDAAADQPHGPIFTVPGGIRSRISSDRASQFHLVWDSDSHIQYCAWTGTTCGDVVTFPTDASVRPAIAVDSHDTIHVVWDRGNGILYRRRDSAADWGPVQTMSVGGNYAAVSTDDRGGVHVAWSENYMVHYCRVTATNLCSDAQKLFRALKVGIAATPCGDIVIVEDDAHIGITEHPYTTRVSKVISSDWDVQYSFANIFHHSSIQNAGGIALQTTQNRTHLTYLPSIMVERDLSCVPTTFAAWP